MLIRYAPRALVYVGLWAYGLQFDVQRDRRADGSFKGRLWAWDYRHPFTLSRLD